MATNNDLNEFSSTFDLIFSKQDRQNKRQRDYQDGDRMRNKVRSAKITKGSVYFCPDSDLKNYYKVPFNVIVSWFNVTQIRSDEAVYENFRRVCRSLFCTGAFATLSAIGKHFGFVDIRSTEDLPRKKTKVDDGFCVIYNGYFSFGANWTGQSNGNGFNSFTVDQFIQMFPYFPNTTATSVFYNSYCIHLFRTNRDDLIKLGKAFGFLDISTCRYTTEFRYEGILIIKDFTCDWTGQMNPVEDYRVWCVTMLARKEYHVLRHRGLIFGYIDLCSANTLEPVFTNVDGLTVVSTSELPDSLIEELKKGWRGQMLKSLPGFQEVAEVAKTVMDTKLLPKASQAFDSVADASSQFISTMSKTSVAVDELNSRSQVILDKIEEVTTGVTDFLTTVKGPVDTVVEWFNSVFPKGESVYGSILDTLIDVALILNRIYQTGLQSASELIMLTFGKYCGYSNGIRFVYQIFSGFVDSWKGQAFDLLQSVPALCSTLSLFTTVLGVTIFKKEFDLSRVPGIIADVSVWYNRVFVQGKNGLSSLTSIFESFFDDALMMIGVPPVSPIGKLRQQANAFCDYVQDFANFFEMNGTFACRSKLIQLQEKLQQGVNIKRSFSLIRGYDSEKQFLDGRFIWLQNWFNKYIVSQPSLIKSRPRPVCVMLQGAGGQGKTTLADAMAVDIIETCLGISRDRPDFESILSQLVYHYRVDPNDVDAYFTGLTENHFIMIWSEAFQESDGPMRASRSISSLMSMVDTAGFMTQQPFESKGKIPYVIPFIIITTNLQGPVVVNNMNWKSQHAVNRRFDFVYNIRASPHCTVKHTKGSQYSFLDVEKFIEDDTALDIRKVNFNYPTDESERELGVSQTIGSSVDYVTMMKSIFDLDKSYRDTFLKLQRVKPAISRKLNFGSAYLRPGVKIEDVRGGTAVMTGQMVKDEDENYEDPIEVDLESTVTNMLEEIDEKEKKGILVVPVSKCVSYVAMNRCSVSATTIHLDPCSILSLYRSFIDMFEAKEYTCVEIVGISDYAKRVEIRWKEHKRVIVVNINENELVYTINWVNFLKYAILSPNAEYDAYHVHCKKMLGENYDRNNDSISYLYLVECLLRESRFFEWDVIMSMSGTKISEEDNRVFGEERKLRSWIRKLKVIGFGLAGILGFFGLVYGGKSLIDYAFKKHEDSKVFRPDIDRLEQVLEEQSLKAANVPIVSKVSAVKPFVMSKQSAKSENVPKIAKVSQFKPINVAKVSNLQSHPVHGPFSGQMIPCSDVEGEIFDVDGDYAEYVGQEAFRDNDAHALRALIWHNTVCIYLVTPEGNFVRRLGNALFVHTRTALIPKHYLRELQKSNFCFFPLQSKKIWSGDLKSCEVRYVDKESDLRDVDLVSITFPDHMAFFSLMKHIVKEEDFAKFSSMPAVITTVAPFINGEEVSLFIKEYHTMVAEAIDVRQPQPYDTPGQQWIIRKGFRYDVHTVDGDCGSAVTAVCRFLPRKILGLHVAGHEKARQGACVALTQELVNSLLPIPWLGQGCQPLSVEVKEEIINKAFGSRGSYKRAVTVPVVTLGHLDDENAEVKDFYSSYKRFKDEDGNNIFGCTLGLTGKGLVMGKSIYNGHSSDKVLITPSYLQGKTSFESTKLPAHIVDHIYEGKLIRVKEESAKKLVNDYVPVDQKCLDESVEHVVKVLRGVPNFEEYLKPLTIEQAVFGDEKMRIKSLNMNSSPGKVLEKKKKGSLRGKRTWINLDTKWIDPSLVEDIHKQMYQWQNLYRCKDVFSGESKSELRTPPKHAIPRMYNSGDLVTLINSKRLFGGLVALIQNHWIETGITVGINCHADFKILLDLLQSKGFKVFDGDFKNFDGKLGVPFTESVMFGWIYFLYKYGKFSTEDILAMFTFSHVVRFYVCIILGFFILMQGGNPSGQFLTTPLNSAAVKVGFRVIWKMIMKSFPEFYSFEAFEQHVFEVANGDDNVVNVSDVVCHLFNQYSVAEGFKSLGMEYTDAAKTGEFQIYKTIDEIQYLKRSIIRYCPVCESKRASENCCGSPSIVLQAGALDKTSILESVLWYKQGVSSRENFASTLSSALQEMYHHGREDYNDFRDEIEYLLSGSEFARLHLKTYDEVEHLYLTSGGTSFGFAY